MGQEAGVPVLQQQQEVLVPMVRLARVLVLQARLEARRAAAARSRRARDDGAVLQDGEQGLGLTGCSCTPTEANQHWGSWVLCVLDGVQFLVGC